MGVSGSSHTSDIKIGTPVATLPGAWRYRVSTGTDRPGVSILWLGEVESLICNFYVSVAARKLAWADPPWDKLACCWDISNQQTTFLLPPPPFPPPPPPLHLLERIFFCQGASGRPQAIYCLKAILCALSDKLSRAKQLCHAHVRRSSCLPRAAKGTNGSDLALANVCLQADLRLVYHETCTRARARARTHTHTYTHIHTHTHPHGLAFTRRGCFLTKLAHSFLSHLCLSFCLLESLTCTSFHPSTSPGTSAVF